jgi:putative transposase
VVTPEQKKEMVENVVTSHCVKAARACKVLGYSRSNLYYEKKMPEKDAQLKQLIQAHLKYNDGRQKVSVKIQKLDAGISTSKIRRVYVQSGFSLYKRTKSRRVKRSSNPVSIPKQPNIEWAIDFMSDALGNGRRFRTLNIIDHYNRKCQGIHCSYSIPALMLTRILDDTFRTLACKPQYIRIDNGPEFTSKHFQTWLVANGIAWVPIQPGHPEQNAIIERMNRTYRVAVLDANIFTSTHHATSLTDEWIHYYNHHRPHQSLSNKTPSEYAM